MKKEFPKEAIEKAVQKYLSHATTPPKQFNIAYSCIEGWSCEFNKDNQCWTDGFLRWIEDEEEVLELFFSKDPDLVDISDFEEDDGFEEVFDWFVEELLDSCEKIGVDREESSEHIHDKEGMGHTAHWVKELIYEAGIEGENFWKDVEILLRPHIESTARCIKEEIENEKEI